MQSVVSRKLSQAAASWIKNKQPHILTAIIQKPSVDFDKQPWRRDPQDPSIDGAHVCLKQLLEDNNWSASSAASTDRGGATRVKKRIAAEIAALSIWSAATAQRNRIFDYSLREPNKVDKAVFLGAGDSQNQDRDSLEADHSIRAPHWPSKSIAGATRGTQSQTDNGQILKINPKPETANWRFQKTNWHLPKTDSRCQ